MSGWMLATGRASAQTLLAALPAGAKTIALANANTLYSVKQRLFISEGDGSETQWLGRVTAVDPVSVSFSRTLKLVKNGGALLWRAGTALDFLEETVTIRRREIRPGVVTERSLGGQFYAIQLAPEQTLDELVFTGLTAELERSLLDWLAGAVTWGLNPYTLVEPSGTLRAVRLTGEPIRRELDSRGTERLFLPIVTAAEGVYP